jgi:hypothetical protein
MQDYINHVRSKYTKSTISNEPISVRNDQSPNRRLQSPFQEMQQPLSPFSQQHLYEIQRILGPSPQPLNGGRIAPTDQGGSSWGTNQYAHHKVGANLSASAPSSKTTHHSQVQDDDGDENVIRVARKRGKKRKTGTSAADSETASKIRRSGRNRNKTISYAESDISSSRDPSPSKSELSDFNPSKSDASGSPTKKQEPVRSTRDSQAANSTVSMDSLGSMIGDWKRRDSAIVSVSDDHAKPAYSSASLAQKPGEKRPAGNNEPQPKVRPLKDLAPMPHVTQEETTVDMLRRIIASRGSISQGHLPRVQQAHASMRPDNPHTPGYRAHTSQPSSGPSLMFQAADPRTQMPGASAAFNPHTNGTDRSVNGAIRNQMNAVQYSRLPAQDSGTTQVRRPVAPPQQMQPPANPWTALLPNTMHRYGPQPYSMQNGGSGIPGSSTTAPNQFGRGPPALLQPSFIPSSHTPPQVRAACASAGDVQPAASAGQHQLNLRTALQRAAEGRQSMPVLQNDYQSRNWSNNNPSFTQADQADIRDYPGNTLASLATSTNYGALQRIFDDKSELVPSDSISVRDSNYESEPKKSAQPEPDPRPRAKRMRMSLHGEGVESLANGDAGCAHDAEEIPEIDWALLDDNALEQLLEME